MKAMRILVFAGLVLTVGLLAGRWCVAQSASQGSGDEKGVDNYIGLHELESFVAFLQRNAQTNVLKKFNDYCNVALVSRSSAELGVRLAILRDLRDGHTNEAMRLLEQQMTSDVVSFSTSYRELPPSVRPKVSLQLLRQAREYCRNYKVRSGHVEVDEIVERAFTSLDEPAAIGPK